MGGLIWIGLLATTPLAQGHSGFHRKTIRVLIKPEGIHLSVQITLPAGPETRRIRRAWDSDGDGRIDEAERLAALNLLYGRYCADLVLSLDGRVHVPYRRSSDGGGLIGPAVRSDALSVSFQLELDLPDGESVHELVIGDGRSGADHVPILLQAGRGVDLLGHDGLEKRRGDKRQVGSILDKQRRLTVSFRLSPRPEPAAR